MVSRALYQSVSSLLHWSITPIHIFEINFKRQFGVDKEFYKDIDWDYYFNDIRDFCFLYCYFEDSEYFNIVGTYIKKPIYKIRLFFDNYLNIELDFCNSFLSELDKNILFFSKDNL